MRIVGYNILKSGRRREHLIAQVLQHVTPDIVILEEAFDPQIVSKIAQLAEFPHYGSKEGCSVAFLSKTSPQSVRWHYNSSSRTPFLEFSTSEHFHIYGLHLYALLSNRAERLRVREIEALLSLTASSRHEPHMLIGDFNTIAPGDTINTASMPFWLRWLIRLNGGDVSRDALRTLMAAGYVDAFRDLHPHDPGYTLPTPLPNSRLDYVFVPAHSREKILQCRVVRAPEVVERASDHYPILVEVTA